MTDEKKKEKIREARTLLEILRGAGNSAEENAENIEGSIYEAFKGILKAFLNYIDFIEESASIQCDIKTIQREREELGKIIEEMAEAEE